MQTPGRVPSSAALLQAGVGRHFPTVPALIVMCFFARGLEKSPWNLFGFYGTFLALHLARVSW